MERMRRLRTKISDLQVGDRKLRFRKAVICTGGRATVPPIPGLRESSYMTHVQLFNLTELPRRFVVIGGGPIGLEMAQSFRRFGSDVTLLEAAPRILGPEDPEASAILQRSLEADGVRVVVDAGIERVEDVDGGASIKIHLQPKGGPREEVVCDKLLVAAGRAANVENLGLEAAGVHIVVTNALFGGRGPPVLAPSTRVSGIVVPRVTFTEPEAERAGLEVDVFRADLEHNDRCILEGDHHGGFVKILCKKGTQQVVGGVIVAERAGEMLAEITLAAQHGIPVSALGHTVHPYPTAGEGVQQCALGYVRQHWEKLPPKA
ncbi:unnamed protein product [Prorocentrum cordatum]|uniref:Dihydrolipoyl dehydrogenase n=1 Tax=Prorocentrum cordatum TaxID=2364126 RepID=A0ABN9U6T1_9DINO|nr:unnamed protein product [Polarella glacialis]